MTDLTTEPIADGAPVVLHGLHHLKLPVGDLDRSVRWYADVLGYALAQDFVEDGVRMGVLLHHPRGGPPLALRLDPDRARAASGFDYFTIGMDDRDAVVALAERLDRLGVGHGGVQETPVGWVLPLLRDPDGHEVRFYTQLPQPPRPEPQSR